MFRVYGSMYKSSWILKVIFPKRIDVSVNQMHSKGIINRYMWFGSITKSGERGNICCIYGFSVEGNYCEAFWISKVVLQN